MEQNNNEIYSKNNSPKYPDNYMRSTDEYSNIDLNDYLSSSESLYDDKYASDEYTDANSQDNVFLNSGYDENVQYDMPLYDANASYYTYKNEQSDGTDEAKSDIASYDFAYKDTEKFENISSESELNDSSYKAKRAPYTNRQKSSAPQSKSSPNFAAKRISQLGFIKSLKKDTLGTVIFKLCFLFLPALFGLIMIIAPKIYLHVNYAVFITIVLILEVIWGTLLVLSTRTNKNRMIASGIAIASVLLFICSFATAKSSIGTVEISSEKDLRYMKNFYIGNYELITDINFEGKEFPVIKKFKGSFDGKGHIISDFTISSDKKTGIIENNKGTIKNLVIAKAKYQDLSSSGCITALNTGTIQACRIESSVTISGKTIAGIAAENRGTIDQCANFASISCTGSSSKNNNIGCGGIACLNTGTISNCYNQGALSSVDLETACYGAGITAYNDKTGKVTTCYNSGSIDTEHMCAIIYKDTGSSAGCYYLKTGQETSATGTSLTEDKMIQAFFFSGFDFQSIWVLNENSYPELLIFTSDAFSEVPENNNNSNEEGTESSTPENNNNTENSENSSTSETSTPEVSQPANNKVDLSGASSLKVKPNNPYDEYVYYKVLGDIVNMRSGPGSNYGKIGSAYENEVVKVAASQSGWLLINNDGKWGWIASSYAEKTN